MIFILPVLVLCISGIILNHNVELGLHKWEVQSPLLRAHYGIEDEAEVSSWGGYPTQNVTMDRVLLDIHTGRIAGTMGIIMMDIAAIMLVLLSLSGAYMWYRRLKVSTKKIKERADG